MGLVDLGVSVGAFGRLLWRSLAASVLLGVMLLGAAVGYTARPLVDLFRDHPSSFKKPVEVVGEGITDGSDAAVKVIWPDRAPIKIVPFETVSSIAPLVPNIGEPKPVRTFRISPDGNIIDRD